MPKSLSQTRWSTRDDAFLALKEGYLVFKITLSEIAVDPIQTPKTKVEANGLCSKADKLETAVLTMVWSTRMYSKHGPRVNKVNKQLEPKDIDIGIVDELYSSLVSFVAEVRANFEVYEKEDVELVEMESDTLVYSADTHRHRNFVCKAVGELISTRKTVCSVIMWTVSHF